MAPLDERVRELRAAAQGRRVRVAEGPAHARPELPQDGALLLGLGRVAEGVREAPRGLERHAREGSLPLLERGDDAPSQPQRLGVVAQLRVAPRQVRLDLGRVVREVDAPDRELVLAHGQALAVQPHRAERVAQVVHGEDAVQVRRVEAVVDAPRLARDREAADAAEVVAARAAREPGLEPLAPRAVARRDRRRVGREALEVEEARAGLAAVARPEQLAALAAEAARRRRGLGHVRRHGPLARRVRLGVGDVLVEPDPSHVVAAVAVAARLPVPPLAPRAAVGQPAVAAVRLRLRRAARRADRPRPRRAREDEVRDVDAARGDRGPRCLCRDVRRDAAGRRLPRVAFGTGCVMSFGGTSCGGARFCGLARFFFRFCTHAARNLYGKSRDAAREAVDALLGR